MNRVTLEKRFAKEDQRLRHQFIGTMLGCTEGRKFLWWLFKLTGSIGDTPYASEAIPMAFNCGRQDVGNRLLAEVMSIDPAAFAALMMEMGNEQLERTDQLAGADSADNADGAGEG